MSDNPVSEPATSSRILFYQSEDGTNRIATDTEIAAAIGGTPVRDLDNEKYATTLRCRDANGETYFVSFSREQVALTSFSDEAIRSRVETWADTVPALG